MAYLLQNIIKETTGYYYVSHNVMEEKIRNTNEVFLPKS